MTTVYLVKSGEYSDFKVNMISSTRENAEFFIATMEAAQKLRDPDFFTADVYDIVEWELDDHYALAHQGYMQYEVDMDARGAVNEPWDAPEWPGPVAVSRFEVTDRQTGEGRRRSWVNAKSFRGAVKVANEERTRRLAAGTWQSNEGADA